VTTSQVAATDVLGSWVDGPSRRSIVDFVERATRDDGAERALARATADGWTVVSRRTEWSTFLPPET
jgi:hypothetical protein